MEGERDRQTDKWTDGGGSQRQIYGEDWERQIGGHGERDGEKETDKWTDGGERDKWRRWGE